VSVRNVLRLSTIRQTLFVGIGALMICLAIAGSLGGAAVWFGAHDTSRQMEGVLAATRQTSDYATLITREIQAGSAYLTDHDPRTEAEFRQLGREAHQLERRFNTSSQAAGDQIARLAAVDTRLADVENAYTLAHRLSDLGRAEAAAQAAGRARTLVNALLTDLARFDQAKTADVESTIGHLNTTAMWRATAVMGSVVVAVLLAIIIALRTIRTIYHPLRLLTHHAARLSEGDLGMRTPGGLVGEFETLAAAMNHAGESLSRVVVVAVNTSDEVTASASDLATASRQISDTANQVTQAVTQVSVGAEAQVRQIHHVTQSLNTIRDSSDGVAAGAEEVLALAGSIETQAQSKRTELERTLASLYDVRTIVRAAAEEVRALNITVSDINKFVVTVGRIADQTNLLSLNAAIEAARAGAAGRGFGVVADEIRKLADQARVAADDVVELTSSVTARVASTSTTMERGVTQVGEIERMSREIDETLRAILAAAERTRVAADAVARTADQNVHAVQDATTNLAVVVRTAEGHATTAMQVSASSEEQSAACEQMSAASVQLLRGSTRLREMVGELKTA